MSLAAPKIASGWNLCVMNPIELYSNQRINEFHTNGRAVCLRIIVSQVDSKAALQAQLSLDRGRIQ